MNTIKSIAITALAMLSMVFSTNSQARCSDLFYTQTGSDADTIFSWAQKVAPHLFPGDPVTRCAESNHLYRVYSNGALIRITGQNTYYAPSGFFTWTPISEWSSGTYIGQTAGFLAEAKRYFQPVTLDLNGYWTSSDASWVTVSINHSKSGGVVLAYGYMPTITGLDTYWNGALSGSTVSLSGPKGINLYPMTSLKMTLTASSSNTATIRVDSCTPWTGYVCTVKPGDTYNIIKKTVFSPPNW
ncbi:MAG: hypothetical protein HY850_02835 [Betaproteobacteria bacterium]|nr:hypothetical protein [Betaproteobacteria bacterium]